MDPTAHQSVALNQGADLQGFRQVLRVFTWSLIPPGQISWTVREGADSFGDQAPAPYGEAGKPIILPRIVSDLIGCIVCHSDPRKYAQLYALVWRMKAPDNPDPYAFTRRDEALVQDLDRMARAVREDIRQMCQGVRFRDVEDQSAGDRLVAWFEPEHFIIEAAAPLLIKRLGLLDWTILTPKGSMWWDRHELAIGPPAFQPDRLEADAGNMSWRPHRSSVFSPPRTEMADTRWRHQVRSWKPPSRAAERRLNAGPGKR